MLKEHARTVAAFVILVDLMVVAAAFVVAHRLRAVLLPAVGLVEGPVYPLGRYLPLLPLVLLIWGTLLWWAGEYRSHRAVPLSSEAASLVKVTLLGSALLVLSIYLLRLDRALLDGDQISRWWIGLLAAISCLGLLAFKVLLRFGASAVRARGYNFRTVLIAGTSEAALAIADAFERHRYWGYRLLGFLSEEPRPEGSRLAGLPILGTLDDLEELVERTPVDELISATDRRDPERESRQLEAMRELGIPVRFAVSPGPLHDLEAKITELDGVPLVTYSRVPLRYAPLAVKRIVDLAVSIVLLIALLPLLAAIALGVRLSSPGPVLFRQQRAGLNGRRFTLLKFRTMYQDAETRRAELAHLNEMDGPAFKIRNDPRVTPLGRLLRRFSLDELPQLLNVVRGDMSLVGPRPALLSETATYERWQKRRLSMRPGITCLWQVEGRNDLDWDRWLELDMKYIDSWSPWLDLKILLRTIPAVVSGRGAS